MNVIGLDHLYLTVSDMERSERFYDAVMQRLGFRKGDKVVAGEPHAHYFNRALQITLRPAHTMTPHDPYAPGLHHVCLQVRRRPTSMRPPRRCASSASTPPRRSTTRSTTPTTTRPSSPTPTASASSSSAARRTATRSSPTGTSSRCSSTRSPSCARERDDVAAGFSPPPLARSAQRWRAKARRYSPRLRSVILRGPWRPSPSTTSRYSSPTSIAASTRRWPCGRPGSPPKRRSSC